MRVRRGCVKGDPHLIGLQVRHQPVNTVDRGLKPQHSGTLDPFRVCVDSHHPYWLDDRAAQSFIHQISADMAGPDKCRVDWIHRCLTSSDPLFKTYVEQTDAI